MTMRIALVAVTVALLLAPFQGCRRASNVRTLILGAFTTPRQAYGDEIIPGFQKFWRDKTGEEVEVQPSFQPSGAQSRAIVGGFEADIAALSLEGDINRIVDAGLITHDWRSLPNRGIVSTSIVVIAVRKGNPMNIADWQDLTRPGVNVLTPDPRTSGGAQWNINAIYGAALRGQAGVAGDDPAAAADLLAGIFRNVSIMDKGARESIISFERGAGDAAITYENEVLVARQAGLTYEYVTPRSTIIIEMPVAIIDKNVDKHGVRDLAEAFIAFLMSPETQRAFAKYGLRSVDKAVGEEIRARFAQVEDPWTVEYLGGWKKVAETIYGPNGVYTGAVEGR
jgi:sulfate transport system substrate-binding protein